MEESGGVGLFTNKNSLSLAGCYARSLHSYRRPTDFFNQVMVVGLEARDIKAGIAQG